MNRDIGKIRQLTILALVLFMIASLLGILILFQSQDDRFQFYLSQADNLLELKRYKDVPEVLLRASRYADTRVQWFSLFKRSYQSSREMDDYAAFQELLVRSRKFIKAGASHDALYTASLLWTGQYEKASASLYAIDKPGYETLTAETLLSYEVYRNYELEDQDPIEFIKDKISSQEDPDFFKIIGILAENDVLLYNAAVLYMETGQTEEASLILNRVSTNRIPPFKIGVIHYALGNFQQALEYYLAQDVVDEMKENQRFSMKQQIGDLYYLLGRVDDSLLSYENALTLHESGSWKLYRNLARLYFSKGYSRKARLLLEKGLKVFPDQIELLSDYVRFFSEEYSLIVKKKLDGYIRRFPSDMEARLLKIHYYPDPMNPTQYQARLWEYFNESGNNEKVTRFLLWYLAGLRDSESIRIILKRYDYGNKKPHWYIFYEAVLLSFQKDTVGALKKMEDAAAIHPSWLYQSNLSMLNETLGKQETARIQLEKAIEGLKAETTLESKGLLLSDMYVRMGDLYLNRKDFKSAAEAYREAVSYNPMNFDAETRLNRIQ